MYSRSEKGKILDEIKNNIKAHDCFYVINIEKMNVETSLILRSECKKKGITVKVVKNSLFSLAIKDLAIDDNDKEKINNECLKKISAVLFIDKLYSTPGRIINKFKKNTFDGISLKFAYVDGTIYYGDEGLKKVSSIKTLEELLSDIALAIQSSINNVVNVCTSSGNKVVDSLKAIK